MSRNRARTAQSQIRADRPATLDDVARKTGLHRTTISQVLNKRANCWASEATRKRVHEAVAELGYRPNLSARALRSGRSHVIGLVMPGFHFSALRGRPAGLTELAAREGYTVALSSHPNDAASEDLVIRRMLDRSVDGLVIYPVDVRGPHRELNRLIKRGFPVVSFEGAALLKQVGDDISVDYREVARVQTRHMLDIGRRRFCIAKPLPEATINRLRDEWILHDAMAAGLPQPLIMRIERPADREIVDPRLFYGNIARYVRKHAGKFDAVLAVDPIAAIVVQVLLSQGIRVPEEVAVIGAGDTIVAHYNAVPLTSVNTEDDWAGEKAFELLRKQIEGKKTAPCSRLTTTARLVIRQSTCG